MRVSFVFTQPEGGTFAPVAGWSQAKKWQATGSPRPHRVVVIPVSSEGFYCLAEDTVRFIEFDAVPADDLEQRAVQECYENLAFEVSNITPLGLFQFQGTSSGDREAERLVLSAQFVKVDPIDPEDLPMKPIKIDFGGDVPGGWVTPAQCALGAVISRIFSSTKSRWW